MKLYLIENSNDVRIWEYPTFNTVKSEISEGLSSKILKIVEDKNGDIFIEKYSNKSTKTHFYSRISNGSRPISGSDWVKRFKVE